MKAGLQSESLHTVPIQLYCLALAAVAFMLTSGCRGRQYPTAPIRSRDNGFPVTLKDAFGEMVRVERKPRRIVSLAPTVTEILYSIGAGDRVVAAAEPADYPPEAVKLPRVGKWFTPSAEKTLAAEPDLAVGSRGNPPDFVAALKKSDFPIFTIDPTTLDGIFSSIRDIGAITGAKQGAEKVISRMKERLGAVRSRIGEVPTSRRPTAFMVVSVNPLWTAGAETFQDDAIRAAGARNAAANLKGFRPFSTESLLAADPTFLLLSTMQGDPYQMKRDILTDPVLKRLTAVQDGRAIVLEANHIMRPGPRIVEAVEAMARAFYPERFAPSSNPSSSATRDR